MCYTYIMLYILCDTAKICIILTSLMYLLNLLLSTDAFRPYLGHHPCFHDYVLTSHISHLRIYALDPVISFESTIMVIKTYCI
jgi:hypothetical protein